jgi:hypothetical protein
VPERVGHLAEPPAFVADEEERDDLEDPLALPVEPVADVAELAEAPPVRARLLLDLAQRGRLARLARVDAALRERPQPFRLAARADRGDHPPAAQPPHQDASRRELALHGGGS